MRSALALCVLLAGGCDRVFQLDDPDIFPVQDVTGAVDSSSPSLELSVSPTTAGNTLVAVIAIKTQTLHVEAFTDSAGNGWTRAVDGVDSLTSGDTGRLEIWYATDAASITSLTVATREPRALAVSFSEWDAISSRLTVVGSGISPAALSLNPTTGPATMTARSLVIAGTAFSGSAVTVLDTPGFTMFRPFSSGSLGASAAFAVLEQGTYEVSWTLPQVEGWTAGIVGLRVN